MKKKFPLGFLITVILLICSCLFSAYMLRDYSTQRFVISLVLAVFFSLAVIAELIIYHGNSLRQVAKLNESVDNASNQVLYYSENAIVLLDDSYQVLWCNKEFDSSIMHGSEVFGCDIGKVLGINMKKLFIESVAKIEYKERIYKITCIPIVGRQKDMIYLSFTDVTEFADLLGKYKRTRPTVLLLVIDNFEDSLQNLKESEKAQVSAAIQTLLDEFMMNTTGVLRRLGHDKFIAFIEDQYLSRIIAAKFSILDKARSLTVGDKENMVTFSIGVGRGGETLEENETYAKQALDLCLGRGGDQAAVKTDNGFRFFGGVAKGIEKKSKSKSRIISNALQELVVSSSNVYIMGHKFADFDAVGAGAGLAYALRLIGKSAYYVVNFERNLSDVLIESIMSEYPDIIISSEDAELDFDDKSVLIIVDTHSADRVESSVLFERANQKVVIDHHRKSVNFINDAVIFHHEPYVSSASEMVTELVQYFKGVDRIPQIFAEGLLAGIMLDTKDFVMRTGVRTFEAAAYLRKCGADTVKVKSFFTNSIDDYRKRSELISSAKIIKNCAVALAPKEEQDIRIIAPQAADELLSIKDVEASFVIYKTGGVINISARSLGLVNVQVIMERLGGGGHQTMAAAQLKDVSEEEAKEMLLEAINAE